MSAAGWQLSAGDFSELLRPASYVLATLASAQLLLQLRRRNFRTTPSLLLSLIVFLLAFLFPLVLLPLLLAAWILTRRETHSDTSSEIDEAKIVETHADESSHAGAQTEVGGARDRHSPNLTRAEDVSIKRELPEDENVAAQASPTLKTVPAHNRRDIALPLLYATLILMPGAYFFIRDYQTVDAHLARAERAKLHERGEGASREYRAALRLEDDAHTRKLLGLELEAAGHTDEALAQFLAAERGGEPDAMLVYRIAAALTRLNRPADAAVKYREFLRSRLCTQMRPDTSCYTAEILLRRPRDVGDEVDSDNSHPN